VAGRTGAVTLAKADVGLSNVDNTSDADKPVSTAQAAADTAVQSFAVQRANHTGTQTASTISDFTTAAATAAPVQSVAGRTGAVTLAKADVGLENVDNTSDANKPVSTATQTALDAKIDRTFADASLTYAATVDLNMQALAGLYRTLTLTGNVVFTTSNRAVGRSVVIRLLAGASARTLGFPVGWVFLGTAPTSLAANKTAVLSLAFFGTADTDCVAAYAVQP
jgi:hypothetical protein